MDPQQRLLLETAWEAFERAGIDPAHAARQPRPACSSARTRRDYGLGSRRRAPRTLEGYLLHRHRPQRRLRPDRLHARPEGPGGHRRHRVLVVAGRAAPGRASRCARGECSLALAGGVTVMATPGAFVEFSRQRGLAADGRCKRSRRGADGTGWAEGAGCSARAALRRAAQRPPRSWRWSAARRSTRTARRNGLTAPNGPAQQRVIRQALAQRGAVRRPTSTRSRRTAPAPTLGDPIEAQALLATYGQDRAARPAAVARLGEVEHRPHPGRRRASPGVIKMVLALRHGVLPQTLHADEPTPHVDWSAGRRRLLTEARAVAARRAAAPGRRLVVRRQRHQRPRHPRAGPTSAEPVGRRRTSPAGRAVGAVRRRARPRCAARPRGCCPRVRAEPGISAADVGYSLATARSPLRAPRRARRPDEPRRARRRAGRRSATTSSPASPTAAGKTVFVFPGQGAQWAGMARELLDTVAGVRREARARASAALAPHVDWSLRRRAARGRGRAGARPRRRRAAGAVRGDGLAGRALAGRTASSPTRSSATARARSPPRTSPARSRSTTPPAWSPCAARRSTALAGTGGMVVGGAARRRGRARPRRVRAAGCRSPRSTARGASSSPATRRRWTSWSSPGPRARRPRPPDPRRLRLALAAGRDASRTGCWTRWPASRRAPREIPFYSTVTGSRLDGTELDAGYWYRNLRETVRFEPVVAALAEAGHDVFVEVSPHPVLDHGRRADRSTRPGGRTAVRRLAAPRRGRPARFLRVAGRGVRARRRASTGPPAFGAAARRAVDLPTYAFQRERYWLDPGAAPAPDPAPPGLSRAGHPLLGAVVALADGDGYLFTGRLSLAHAPLAGRPRRGRHGRAARHRRSSSWRCAPATASAAPRSRS